MTLDDYVVGYRNAVDNARAHPDEDHSDCVESWRKALLSAQRRHVDAFYASQAVEFQRRTR